MLRAHLAAQSPAPTGRRPCTRAVLPCRRRLAGAAASAEASVSGAAATSAAVAPGPSRVRIPASIHEVDNGKILGFGADLSADHPGYRDEAYKQRRVAIANIARAHEIGDPIPQVEYTPEEVAVWDTALARLSALFPTYACKEYLRALPLFGFRQGEVPQLQDISDILHATSGWQVRPVAGLMHPRDFLAGLAFKYFHSTQYMRHASNPMYTPEPDVVHELIGHVPLLTDPDFAAMAQAIGVASLGADEKQIWHLTKVYWYTVEFGLVREGRALKAFGAGVLSSYGELEWFSQAEATPFDPFSPLPKMSYKDGFQKRYFVLDSFGEGARRLREYALAARLPEQLRGDASVA